MELLGFILLTVYSLYGSRAALAQGYEFDPGYLVPSQCRACDAKSCPQLTFCAGTVVKDHCGCCNRCSSDLFQPHRPNRPSNTAEPPLLPTDGPNLVSGDHCQQRKCPKFKVCVINMQGLPICTCPSEYICRRRHGKKRSKRQKGDEPIEICGTDGITYLSRCHLKIANCNSDRRIKRKNDGPCLDNVSETNKLHISMNKQPSIYTENKVNSIGHDRGFPETDISKSRKYSRKLKQKRKQRKREKKERKRKRHQKDKNRREKRKQRSSRRMKRRNEGYNKFPQNYDYIIGKNTKWSKSQVRKSRI